MSAESEKFGKRIPSNAIRNNLFPPLLFVISFHRRKAILDGVSLFCGYNLLIIHIFSSYFGLKTTSLSDKFKYINRVH